MEDELGMTIRLRAGSRSRRAFGVALLLAACTRGPIDDPGDEGPTVDADIYARGFCSLRCWRLEECGLDEGVAHEQCEEACVDDAVAALPDDPCWAEAIELRRCVVRWSACGDVPEESAPVGPGTTCAPQADALDACER